MVTVDDALTYIGIDYADEVIVRNATRSLNAAKTAVDGAIGADAAVVLNDDIRLDELTLIYFEDLYNNRGINQKVSGAVRNLVATLETQLRIDYSVSKGSVST